MITPFKAMDFSLNDVVTKDDMDTMQNNLQWIYDNTPRSRFYGNGSANMRANNIILCGTVTFGANKTNSTVTASVKFGTAFHPSCNPVVTTGVVAQGLGGIYCVVNGAGTSALSPTPTGIDITATVKDNNTTDTWKISKPFLVNWQAYGYRVSTVNDF